MKTTTPTPDQLTVQQLIYQLTALSSDVSVASASCKHHAALLARALTLVSHRHVISAPTRTRSTVLEALDELKAALQQHQQKAAKHQQVEAEYEPQHQELLQTTLLALWANVAAYELLVALADVITAVEFVPHALRFWKRHHRDPFFAAIENGSFDWMQSESQRVTVEERIYSLAYTRDTALETLGNLKELATRIWATTPDDGHELRGLVVEASRMLEHAYDSSAFASPRRGKGAFKTLAPLDFTRIRFEPCVTSETGTTKLTVASLLLSLDKLHTNLERFEASRTQFMMCFNTAMAPCVVPSKLRQRWLPLTVTAACVITGGVWVLRDQRGFQQALTNAKTSATKFLDDLIVVPVAGLVEELTAKQKPVAPDTVGAASRTLLAALASVTVKDEWMAELRRAYQTELDAQKELLLYYRIIAAFPATILLQNAWLIAIDLIRIVRAWVRNQSKMPRDVTEELQDIVHRLEHLINKQLSATADSTPSAREVGKFLVLLHQLRELFDSNRRRFDEGVQQRFHQDINDLAADGLQPTQRLWIIQRMHHAHSFCV